MKKKQGTKWLTCEIQYNSKMFVCIYTYIICTRGNMKNILHLNVDVSINIFISTHELMNIFIETSTFK